MYSRSAIPNLFGPKEWFHRKRFFHRWKWEVVSGWLKHIIDCALYFSYYYMSSTSDHQASDPGGWDPLLQIKGMEHTLRKGHCSWRMQCPFQRGITEHRSKAMVTSEQDPSLPSQEPGMVPVGLSGLSHSSKGTHSLSVGRGSDLCQEEITW